MDEGSLKQRDSNHAHIKWLATSKREDIVQFKDTRSLAKKVIRLSKNTSFQREADEGYRGDFHLP